MVKRPGCEKSRSKTSGAKRPGPKRVNPKSPGAKTLLELSLYHFETSSMIVTFPVAFFIIVRFFYYYHLNLI